MGYPARPADPQTGQPAGQAVGGPTEDSEEPTTEPAPSGVCAPGGSAPCVTCRITSETVMTEPANRARTDLGIGERVNLTFSLGNANWTITAGQGSLSSPTGASVVYTAPPTAQQITISATGGGCTAVINFNVIAPNRVRMRVDEVLHNANTTKIGMWTRVFFLPDTVNFHRVQYIEDEQMCTANGVYACNNNTGHFPNPSPLSATTHVVAGFGTRMRFDQVRSGFCAGGTTQADGRITFRGIPTKCRVRGTVPWLLVERVRQQCTSAAAGAGPLRARKAGAVAGRNFGSPGNNY